MSLSATGSLCAFTFAETDLVIDVNAWLADDEGFDALVPARIFETRSGESTVDGEFDGVGRLDAMSVMSFQVAGRGGVDPDASAEVLAQKLTQDGYTISIRSVQRVIAQYGLQKKTPRLPPHFAA